MNPRVYRRLRALTVLLILGGAGTATAWYGPGLAARYAPTGLLIWMTDADSPGTEWAGRVRQARLSAAYTAVGSAGLALEGVFRLQSAEFAEHDWAGEYAHTQWCMLAGRSLLLTETEAMWSYGVGMQPGGVMQGLVIEFDGTNLRLELPAERELLRWGRTFDSELTLVRWENWRFLVAREDLLDFCNDVNAGEPLDAFHLTKCLVPGRSNDQTYRRPATEHAPRVPAEFARCIIRAPIRATVTHSHERSQPSGQLIAWFIANVGRSGYAVGYHELDLQTDRRTDVFVGMRLYAHDRLGMAHVTAIAGEAVQAKYVELSDAGAAPPTQADLELSTVAPLPFPPPPHGRGLRPRPIGFPPGDGYVTQQRRMMTLSEWTLRELAREFRRSD